MQQRPQWRWLELSPAEQAATAGQIFLWVAVPYAALAILLAGFCYRVAKWAWSPVPFRIPTTCGQQKSLPWIRPASLDNPSTGMGAVARMALEILLFRSLFRNNRAELHDKRYMFGESKALWLGASGLPLVAAGDCAAPPAAACRAGPGLCHHACQAATVFSRSALLSSISPMWWLFAPDCICSCGDGAILWFAISRDWPITLLSCFCSALQAQEFCMRYLLRVDLVAVKRLALGLATFHPVVPAGLSAIFLIHLMLICTLAVYFPFSKLMHLGGVFLSPTRNLANNNRSKRISIPGTTQ